MEAGDPIEALLALLMTGNVLLVTALRVALK